MANRLHTRINQLERLLNQINNTDMVTGNEELFPITISAGMACSIDFDVSHPHDDAYLATLEKGVYNNIKSCLTNYQRQLQTIFNELN